ncbi:MULTISPECIES: RcnB family protein [unclassified Aureimonas]|uniref:RcnB family protein n=1 Tax=unclassified Aureimonas TaxID=2615206 RepID=UPI0006F6E57C|nr:MULTISPECIES: RcnB family protein [unclassified Aureimonas]KQT52296.1 hypothetical protein ASG62_16730 [Aureimonas sp. Leaf427]KQT61818.1 hypothetical protein ASG54_23615 [Aureimonas sp. Leaf460]
MKKSILTALALTFLMSPMLAASEASAQNRPDHARQELRQDRQELRQDQREIRKGLRQASKPSWLKRGGRYGRGGSEVREYKRYGLRAPGRGQRWVRYGNDYLLITITSGVIASIIAGR